MNAVSVAGLLLSGIVAVRGIDATPDAGHPAHSQVESACSLITTEEAAAALHIEAAEAKSNDSPQMRERGRSGCVFGPTEGFGDVVTVLMETGLEPVDQERLNEIATAMGVGETAKPIEGFGVPAAAMEDLPTIVAQKGSVRVLISAPTMDETKSLMAKALARIH